MENMYKAWSEWILNVFRSTQWLQQLLEYTEDNRLLVIALLLATLFLSITLGVLAVEAIGLLTTKKRRLQ